MDHWKVLIRNFTYSFQKSKPHTKMESSMDKTKVFQLKIWRLKKLALDILCVVFLFYFKILRYYFFFNQASYDHPLNIPRYYNILHRYHLLYMFKCYFLCVPESENSWRIQLWITFHKLPETIGYLWTLFTWRAPNK